MKAIVSFAKSDILCQFTITIFLGYFCVYDRFRMYSDKIQITENILLQFFENEARNCCKNRGIK